MNHDVQNFIELMKTNETLQQKLMTALEHYDGEETPEAAFQNLIVPLAEEAGYQITWKECQEYMAAHELNQEEMDQVAGGTPGEGYGYGACWFIGSGNGYVREDDGKNNGIFKTICLSIGIGFGAGACASKGVST